MARVDGTIAITQFGKRDVLAANFAELPAADDRLDGRRQPVVVRGQLLLHFRRAAARRKAAPPGPGRSRAACGRTAARTRRGASSAGSLRRPSRPSNSRAVHAACARVSIGRSPRSLSRRRPMASKPSSEKPNGSIRSMADGALRSRCVCFSTSCRTVRPSVAVSSSGSCGTSFGGRGSFSPSSTSLTQLPRRMGLVRDAPDCLASVVA